MNINEESILKRMMHRSDEAFLIFDTAKLCFTYASPSFEEITSISCKQLLNGPESMIALIHPEDQKLALNLFRHLPAKQSNTVFELRIIRPDKGERWIRLKIYPLFKGKEIDYLTCIMEDDTARKAGAFSLQKINGWKNSILEILAHDLRGPIGIVKTLTTAIDRKVEGIGKEDVLKWTKMIRDISQRNIELIQSLIKKESLDSAGVAVTKERMDLVWGVGEVMSIYRGSRDESLRDFIFTRSHHPIFARVDSMKFLQIINNLVSNALKFSHDNGVIKVHVEKLEKTALITVADKGVGIPKSMLPVIFNKYTPAGRQAVDGQESIGLGMWIVKSFTEAHGGTVWIESEENVGTTVYVEIPLGEVEELIE